MPLGESYLELIAVVGVEEAEQSEFGRAVRRALTEDKPLVARSSPPRRRRGRGRLDLEVEEKSREAADGSTLGSRLAGLEQVMKSGALPFLVQWQVRPSGTPARRTCARGGRARIAWVEVSTGDEDALRQWLGDEPTSRFGSPTAIPALPPPRSRRAAPSS